MNAPDHMSRMVQKTLALPGASTQGPSIKRQAETRTCCANRLQWGHQEYTFSILELAWYPPYQNPHARYWKVSKSGEGF